MDIWIFVNTPKKATKRQVILQNHQNILDNKYPMSQLNDLIVS